MVQEEKLTRRQIEIRRKLAVQELEHVDALRERPGLSTGHGSGALLAERADLLEEIRDYDRQLAEMGQAGEQQQAPVTQMAKAVQDVRAGRLSLRDGFHVFKTAREQLRGNLMKSLPGQVLLGEEGLCGAATRAHFMAEFPNLGDPESWFAQQ